MPFSFGFRKSDSLYLLDFVFYEDKPTVYQNRIFMAIVLKENHGVKQWLETNKRNK